MALRPFALRILVALGALISAAAGEGIALKLSPASGKPAAWVEAAGGVVEVHGPLSIRATPLIRPGAGKWVLEMEYFSVGNVPAFAALVGPGYERKGASMLPEIGHSEAWSPYTASLGTLPDAWTDLQFDLPVKPDGVLQLRNIRLRPERPAEFAVKETESAFAANAEMLKAYLARKLDSRIDEVTVEDSQIRIRGVAMGADVFLADIPMELILGKGKPFESLVSVVPDGNGNFSLCVPRKVKRSGLDYDRLLSRWQIVRRTGTGFQPLSHARYAEEVASRTPQPPPAVVRSKKGLGGWGARRIPNEIEDLGISAVTVNVFAIHTLVSLKPIPGGTPFQWQGRTYYANEAALARFDQTFLEAERCKLMVSAILLVTNPAKTTGPQARLLGHPDALKEGSYGMPNVISEEGIAYYGAIVNLITERWSKSGGPHGRVHHWIIHNEVDAGWVWTNAGEKEDIVYMDLYQRSMRLVDLIARQYDSNSRPFITLTHHWAEQGSKNWYGSKRMVELLLSFCKAEGDFPWAMAYHPYPQDLRNPRTWKDQQATFDFNTAKITPWNLEVLDAYMKQPALLYRGKVRPVHLSENGFNSKDYSPQALEEQAAGMALAWKKMARLSSIESWQYHNWIDNRKEGGLRIGLRRFPDDEKDPLGRKPIWFLYQALGTPAEDTLAAPYLKTIGIQSWDEILHRGEIR